MKPYGWRLGANEITEIGKAPVSARVVVKARARQAARNDILEDMDKNEKAAPEVVYVTKYALTQGIMVVRNSTYILHEKTGKPQYLVAPGHLFVPIKDVAVTLDEAREKARQMARDRIESLKNQILLLEKSLNEEPKQYEWSGE